MIVSLKTKVEYLPDELRSLLFRETGYSIQKQVDELAGHLKDFWKTIEADQGKEEEAYRLYLEFCRDLGVQPEKIEVEDVSQDTGLVRVKTIVESMEPEKKNYPDKFIDRVAFPRIERLRNLRNLAADVQEIIETLLRIKGECRSVLEKYEDADIKINITPKGSNIISLTVSFDLIEDSNYVV